MEITYDEYIAVWQSPDSKSSLDDRIAADAQKRYAYRMNGVGTDYNARTELAKMSPTSFRSLRIHQMGQLLNAYRDANKHTNHNLLRINFGTTNPNDIRRVVGEKPGYIYNDGILALDHETIIAVQHLASLMESGYGRVQEKKWAKSLSFSNLEKVVDEMIAVKGILAENMKLPYQEIVGDKVYRETNIAKRAIGKVQYPVHSEIGQITDLPQVGENCFGIKDYELSWNKLVERSNKSWTKTVGKLFKFLDKKIHPDADRNNPNKIGNRTVEVEDR